jgi:hypothetical protein
MAPGPAWVSIAAPRATATDSASPRVNAPAAYAAATSPRLCPITADGRTPTSRRASTRAICHAVNPAWRAASSRSSSSPSSVASLVDQGARPDPMLARSSSSLAARDSASPGQTDTSERARERQEPPCPGSTKITPSASTPAGGPAGHGARAAGRSISIARRAGR